MIKRLLLENLSLKAAAVVLAILLWIFVSSRGQTEVSLEVPIEFINIPAGIEIAKRTVKSANLVIRGNETLLKALRQGDVRVIVDVSKAREGEAVYAIKNDDVSLPRTAAVMRIEPPSVKLMFERMARKEVRVRPAVTGIPETGYYVKHLDVKPKTVVIEGAESDVNKVGYLKTESIDITGLTEDVRQEVDLVLAGRNIRTKIDKVEIAITIARRGR
ncbi:MAG TPA: CdaR family protein [Thermodesulfovibrionales bacterium]|jgi:YbbR domain-containing protein|nr:CdaR family protein [Thermodesulfovibrionales bacterium]